MDDNHDTASRSGPARALRDAGGRAVSLTLRPLSGAATAAAHATIDLERAALERILDSPQFEQLVSSAVNSDRVQTAVLKAFRKRRGQADRRELLR